MRRQNWHEGLRTFSKGVCRLLVAIGLGLSTSPLLDAQSLTWLGVLPGGSWSSARSVSADGTIVGIGNNADERIRAFRWTAPTGMQELAPLPGFHESWVYDISPDGSVIVGWSRNADDLATRWTSGGAISGLGTLGGQESWASGVSADGSVIVGVSINPDRRRRAFRWTATEGMQDLGTLGGNFSEAYAVSADGTTIVGVAREASGYDFAFRWTAATGMQNLGTLEGGYRSMALDVSADGSVVVGWSHFRIGNFVLYRAFRWTEATGMVNLGELSEWDISVAARGVSADGTVVVGSALEQRDNSYRYRAFRWTETTGIQNLNEVYADLLTNNSVLVYAYAVSPDGRYIVGNGYNAATRRTEAFLLDTMVTITGNVELRDFTGDVTQIPVTVELRQGGNVLGTRTLNLDAGGNYAFAAYPGTSDLAFKASHWLRTVVPNVSVSGSSVTVNVSLTNGDIDGDNEVTLFDFGALVAAFGSVPGDSNWNANADLDGDEEVTLFDFGVLVRNFGAIGDE